MRRFMGIIVASAWLAATVAVQGGDRDTALAVIEKAIKAHGGVEALNKAQRRSRTGRGIVALGGETRLTTEETVHLPNRCRMVLELERNRFVLVLNGDKGWMQKGGETQKLDKSSLQERQEELYVWWLMNLTPLLKNEFQLRPLADAKVNGQDTAVVRVSHRDYPDARLFFDKKSGLLLKIARRGTESGLPVTKEYLYSDHKEFNGVKMPTKEVIILNGTEKLSEVTFDSYKVLAEVEDKLFDKP
ncbi:MAG: LolA-like protein [Gemmataceae bacterium]